MANVARASDVSARIGEREPASGSGGAVLMGSAIGFLAAVAFGVFLWLSVH